MDSFGVIIFFIFLVLIGGVFGFLIGSDVSDDGLARDCSKIGYHISKGSVYQCSLKEAK